MRVWYQNSMAMSLLAIFIVTIDLVPFSVVEGLHCYECLAWMVGQPGTNEACRDDVPPEYTRVDCNAATASLLDLNTGKIRSRVPGDTSSRAIGDLVCVKVNGTERNTFNYVVFRACAIARVDENLNGVCQIVNEEFHIPGYLTMMAGSNHFHCTGHNCNTGSVSGPCGDGDGNKRPGPGTGNGASFLLISWSSWSPIWSFLLLLAKIFT